MVRSTLVALQALCCTLWMTACDVDDSPAQADSEDESGQEALACDPISGQDLFARRIAPLLADDRPSSCNECHLTGLDLGSFARETPCRTMACMAEQGLVDLQAPSNSLILSWIDRADPDLAGSELVTEETIAEEYDAMLQWIEYSSRCGAESCEPIEDPCGSGASFQDCEIANTPVDQRQYNDPGDCSDATLEGLFAARVYAWRGRCFPCHFQDSDIDVGAPRWIKVGSCELGASATMRTVLERGLVNTQDPSQSLLLLKPLDEEDGGVFHEGHHKIANTQEQAYIDFLQWIERYSACQQ